MHWFNYSLLAITLWASYCQNSVAQTESSKTTEETTIDPKENEIFFHPIIAEPTSTGIIQKSENLTGHLNSGKVNASDEVSLKAGLKQDGEKVNFDDIKPLLLFPILPYLFPPGEDEIPNAGKDEFSAAKNKTSKIDGSPADAKPFIFFDFAFNIRQIPVSNATDNLNDSEIINVKKLSSSSSDSVDSNPDVKNNRRRRNTKMEAPGFFDYSPLFPDSELDEFLPKPDLFFPDFPFHHKQTKKLSRSKRDQKKKELKNDLKSFFDAFDEAFMRTKRELEWVDPILNFLRGGEQSFEEEKKEANDDLFGHLADVQEKPRVKWTIQRNIKRLNDDREADLTKVQDSPTIIVDKVVKIGEFHVHDDGHEKNKKRGLMDSKRKFLGRGAHDGTNSGKNDENMPKSIFELIKQEGTKRKKRVHPKISNPEEVSRGGESRVIRNHSQVNATTVLLQEAKRARSLGKKGTEEFKSDSKEVPFHKRNNTEKLLDLIKMFDTLKGNMEKEMRTNNHISLQKQSQMASLEKEEEVKNIFKQDLKKNLTELLKQFLILNKNLEGPKTMEKLSERDDPRLFDWSEKETMLNTKDLEKGSRERRQKDKFFEDEDVDNKKDEDKFDTNMNHMMLQVTLPTMFVLGFALLLCFLSMQVKGKVCTQLFRPREIYIVNKKSEEDKRRITNIHAI